MACVEVQKQLQEYLDGQLPAAEAQDVAAHVHGCEACGKELALLRCVDAGLATQPLLEEPVDFAAQVMTMVRASSAAPPAFRFRWEDALVGLLFASTMATALVVLATWCADLLSAVSLSLDSVTGTWLAEIGGLWHAARAEPFCAAWVLSSACVAALIATSAVVLWHGWPRRFVPGHKSGYTYARWLMHERREQ